jgi:putative phosphoribosyl transferase
VFANRAEAGTELAGRLGRYKGAADALVLGIPRGGVVVAAQVARELGLPLDIVSAAKVGASGNPEFAVGAVAPDGEVVVNPDAGVSVEQVAADSGPARAKIARQLALFREGRSEPAFKGRTTIVVDDGIATGLTAIAAARYLRRRGAHVVLAVPVASRQAAEALKSEVDELVVAELPISFGAVGQFYSTFGQTSDQEVSALLDEARRRTTG